MVGALKEPFLIFILTDYQNNDYFQGVQKRERVCTGGSKSAGGGGEIRCDTGMPAHEVLRSIKMPLKKGVEELALSGRIALVFAAHISMGD